MTKIREMASHTQRVAAKHEVTLHTVRDPVRVMASDEYDDTPSMLHALTTNNRHLLRVLYAEYDKSRFKKIRQKLTQQLRHQPIRSYQKTCQRRQYHPVIKFCTEDGVLHSHRGICLKEIERHFRSISTQKRTHERLTRHCEAAPITDRRACGREARLWPILTPSK